MSDWWWTAHYFETCNCDYGCPCNTTAIPTDGTCQAIDAWQIEEGAYGDVSLDGLGIALLVRWPNAIHEGNGHAVVYVDERADERQRDALARIGSGQAGDGGPFAIFATTYAEPAKTVVGPIEFTRAGKRASLRLGSAGGAEWGPVLSRMDGSEADVRLVIPGGFIFDDGEIVNSERCEVDADELRFSHKDTSGFLAEVAYNR